MDGRWASGDPNRIEDFGQANLNRMKMLRVNTIAAGANDASGFASQDPSIPPLDTNEDGAPHFLLSPETNDGQPTLGFEFGLLDIGFGTSPVAPGFTVTVFRLVEVAMQQGLVKQWLSFAPLLGVNFGQLFSSFDINTAAIRFQISNVNVDGSLVIALAEL